MRIANLIHTKQVLLISLLMCCSGSIAAQSDVNWVNGTVFNFGDINEGDGAVSHKFLWSNKGTTAVSVLTAKGKCSCTTAKYDTNPVQPGDTASIIVTFDPKDKVGEFKQRVTIRHTAEPSTNYLFVKGRITTSEMRIVRDFPIESGAVRLGADTAVIESGKTDRCKNAVTVKCINHSETTIRPTLSGKIKGIETDVTPSAVPAGERFTLVFTLENKYASELKGSHCYNLYCGDLTQEPHKITIIVK